MAVRILVCDQLTEYPVAITAICHEAAVLQLGQVSGHKWLRHFEDTLDVAKTEFSTKTEDTKRSSKMMSKLWSEIETRSWEWAVDSRGIRNSNEGTTL